MRPKETTEKKPRKTNNHLLLGDFGGIFARCSARHHTEQLVAADGGGSTVGERARACRLAAAAALQANH